MKAFQSHLKELEAADTQVLGVSVDSPFANKAWAQQLGVEFPLLSDLGGDVSREYGIYNPKYKAARRVTYVIDKNGKVVSLQVDHDALDPSNTVEECQRRKMKE